MGKIYTSGSPISKVYEVGVNAPFDTRLTVQNVADLTDGENGGIAAQVYRGMTVYVHQDKSLYVYSGASNSTWKNKSNGKLINGGDINNWKYIEIQSGTSHIRVNLSQLLYADVYDRKTILHMKNESIEYYGQLSVLENLVGKDFYRIHRSYLVNMKYVERYDRTSVTLKGGDNIPISRREYDGFLKAYMEYSRRRIDS